MAQTYLGSTLINQSWLGNTQINKDFGPINGVLVMAQDTVAVYEVDNYGNLLNSYAIDGIVRDIAIIDENSYIVAGRFSTIDGVSRSSIAKISNGSVDTTGGWGGAGLLTDNQVIADVILRQSNGKLITRISFGTGTSGSYNGSAVGEYFRINADGTLGTYAMSGSVGEGLYTSTLDSDDNLWFGGIPSTFTVNGGTESKGIVKLDPDGNKINLTSVASGFLPTNQNPRSFQAIGNKILVVGGFTSYEGVSGNVFLLNSDGTIDSGSFNAGAGLSGSVASVNAYAQYLEDINKIALFNGTQSDTTFTQYSGSAVQNFALINLNGTLDTTWQQPVSASWYEAKREPIAADTRGNLYLVNVDKWDGVRYDVTSSQNLLKQSDNGGIAPFNYSFISTGSSDFMSAVVKLK